MSSALLLGHASFRLKPAWMLTSRKDGTVQEFSGVYRHRTVRGTVQRSAPPCLNFASPCIRLVESGSLEGMSR